MNIDLENNNYIVIKNFISKSKSKELSDNFNSYIKEYPSDVDFSDSQVPETPSKYDYIPFVEVLCQKLPEVTEIVGESLLPTYTYARVYKKGDILESHRDREACEISLTVHLDGDKPWEIWIETPSGEKRSVLLESGDAMLYLGRIANHWRDPYEGEHYTQVFLHYVKTYGECAFAYFDKNKVKPPSKPKNIEDKKESPTLIIPKPKSSQTLEEYIKVFNDIIPETLCDLIIDHYKDSDDWCDTLIGGGSVNKNIRNCSGILLSDEQLIQKDFQVRKKIDVELHQHLMNSVEKYKSVFPNFLPDIDTGYQLLRYTEGQFYTEHIDSFVQQQRSVSCTINLNDDFEGGEFAFFDRELIFYPNKGSVLMFPSNFMYPHEVMPVKKGTRYSIITWYV